MSMLSSVTTGRNVGPQIHTIIGTNGVGKTTWAASFPKALVLDIEGGSNHLSVARVPADKLQSLDSVKAALKELIETNHQFQSVVIDSVEALELLISDSVCAEGNVKSIELYEGGYGKGFTRTREIMRDLFNDFRALQAKGITVILVAHTQVKTINDPVTNQSYDRVIMRANDKMAALVRDLSDNVFYATYKVLTAKEKGKTRAYGDGQRVLYSQWRPGFDAKNRLDLPLELPLSYDAFAEACKSAPEANSEDLVSDIKAMSEKLDAGLKSEVKKMLEKYKGNPAKLAEVKNRLMKFTAA